MAIEVSCRGCQKRYRLKDELAGRRMRCSVCKGVLEVPALVEDDSFEDDEQSSVAIGGRVAGRTSRDYTHNSCGESTTVDGPEFSALADPLARMVATYCSHCEVAFPLDQFVWSDTQERITDYYRRYQSMGTPFQNFMASRAGMFWLATVPFGLGLLAYFILGNQWFIPGGLLLGLIVIVLHVTMIGPAILRQVVGTSDPRELN
jgi:hypothetical protein